MTEIKRMMSDTDDLIDNMCKDLNAAQRKLRELQQYYQNDSDMNTEKMCLLIGELLTLSRRISDIKREPDVYQSDQIVIMRMQYGKKESEHE